LVGLAVIAFVLISPVFVYAGPFAVGIATDITRLGYGPMVVGLLVSAGLRRLAYRWNGRTGQTRAPLPERATLSGDAARDSLP
jgi:hypothetical protein